MSSLRRVLTVVSAVALAVVSTTVPAAATSESPPQARAFGASLQEHYTGFMAWAVGAPDAPILNTCGQQVGRVFYLSSALGTGQEATCDIPAGVPIVTTQGSYFAYYGNGPSDPSDQEILDEVDFFVPELVDTQATLDGNLLPLNAVTTSVVQVPNSPTSFGSVADPSVAHLDTVRIAAGGYALRLPPLSRGTHELAMTTTVDFLDLQLDITVELNVG